MCDLFGLSCNGQDKATTSLQYFADHSTRNPHGWGVAYYRGSEAVLRKKPEAAKTSDDFHMAIGEAESNLIISHIRNASRGELHERNCHPFMQVFQDRHWVFAHNGHVDGIGKHHRAKGETDSETVFNILLDGIEEYHSINEVGGNYSGLKYSVKNLFNEYEFGRDIKLNFLLTDGNMMYAFNHHPEKPFYYARRQRPYGGAFTISTQKLDGDDWKKLPEDRILLVNNGEVQALSHLI